MLKEDCQAFGVLIAKAATLEEAFDYPLTSVPLSIAETTTDLRSSDKAGFRNHILKESDAVSTVHPIGAKWIVDGMAIVRSAKPESTYLEYFRKLLIIFLPPRYSQPLTVEIIMDNYIEHSAKECTRRKRGEQSTRIHITGFGQKMPQGNSWQNLLKNGENKTDLIHMFVEYLKLESTRKEFTIPLIVTEKEKTWKITKTEIELRFNCNHEEADSRMVLHASIEDVDCVIQSKDTDVLVLMVYAFNHKLPEKKWYMNYEFGKFADIRKITKALGNDLSHCLPKLHTLTGCDTTSYFYRVGKISVLKKVMKNPELLSMISNLGCKDTMSIDDIAECRKFIQTVMYNGKSTEDYLQTRIRLYKNQLKKTSLSIPPDSNSCTFAILRAHYQAYQWLKCLDVNIANISLTENGWHIDDDGSVIPLWYTCSQLPPSLNRCKKKVRKTHYKSDGNNADVDEDEVSYEPPKKKKPKEASKENVGATRGQGTWIFNKTGQRLDHD